MKKLISIILAVIMIFGCFAIAGYAESTQLRTNYDATKYTGAYVCTKQVESGFSDKTTYKYGYDSKGNLTKSDGNVYKYDSKGNLISEPASYDDSFGICTYTYDSQNRVTKAVFKSEYGTSETTTYYYNSKGYLTKDINKTSGGYKITTTYTYNSKGLPTKATIKDSKGKTWGNTYTYNSKGYLTKAVYKYTSGSKETYTYAYDSKGNLTKEVEKYSDGYYNAYTYTYDSNGNVTKKVNKSSYGHTDTDTYSYNSKGQLAKETMKYDGDPGYTITYNYDSNGNLSKEAWKMATGSNITTTYTYKKLSSACIISTGNPDDETGYTIHMQYATCKYTGKAKTPNITIENLKQGVDYRVTYSNNVKVGTAKAKLTFFGEYATQRPVTITYKITK